MTFPRVRLYFVLLLVIAAVSGAVHAQSPERTTLNFRNADMTAFIEDMAALTGYTFVVDPEIRGVVTITSQGPVTREEAFQVFLATLRVHGFSAVQTAPGVYQIRAEREGARSGAPLGGEDGMFSSSVVRLQSASAREAVRTLSSMVSNVGTITALESGNAVVVVDYASNISAIEQALRALDRDNTVVEMVSLENVSADEMARIIERLRQPAFQGEDNRRYAFNIAPVPASNTLLIRGETNAVADIIALVRRVDAVSRSNQSFRVIALNHANGESLLPILEQVSAGLSPADSEGVTSRQASIAHHAPTNSVVVNADPDQLRELELVIRQLDVRRPQVLVEAIIVEISDQTARDLGLQLLLSGNDGSVTPFISTRFGASPDLLAIAGAATVRGDSDAAETVRETALQSILRSSGALVGVGGQNSNGAIFGAILNALEADTSSNILSKPSILTLDNEEASIIVGQQIPITTGEVLGDSNTNPFRTIERQDVGVQLQVQPQISDGDTIRLHLRQEVSSVAGPVGQDFSELITNNRAIETTVLADNGEIIVLGGLIERDDQSADSGVPGLRSIPVLGRAFRNEGRSERRTNLVVFIRPTIVRSAADMRDIALQAYTDASAEQRRATGGTGSSLEEIVNMMMDAPAVPPAQQ
ncbi:MAG: type 2a secretion system secretin GspD [Oceanicaulis sp. HLUCCA04]|nr:MAG: type 2a secretion system secretin GspD [Oceanicaulis sp. HLUCCA04]